jgi:hypothetical protein
VYLDLVSRDKNALVRTITEKVEQEMHRRPAFKPALEAFGQALIAALTHTEPIPPERALAHWVQAQCSFFSTGAEVAFRIRPIELLPREDPVAGVQG